jgi:hypothetical protein
MIAKINPSEFSFRKWSNGTPIDIVGESIRTYNIEFHKSVLRKYAIGYCNGESLIVRPKINHKAVMFLKDSEYYWFHLTNEEFNKVFY